MPIPDAISLPFNMAPMAVEDRELGPVGMIVDVLDRGLADSPGGA
jgi:hypothetical protein